MYNVTCGCGLCVKPARAHIIRNFLSVMKMNWPGVVVTVFLVVVVVGARGVRIVDEDVTGQDLEGKRDF